MKKYSVWLWSILVLISVHASGQSKNIEIVSSYKLDETVSRLTKAIENRGLTLFSVIDHSGAALKAEMNLRPTTVLIFGNPKIGTRLMHCDQAVGLELPLKMLVFEAIDGQTYIAYRNPQSWLSNYDLEDCQEVITKVRAALNSIATSIVEQ